MLNVGLSDPDVRRLGEKLSAPDVCGTTSPGARSTGAFRAASPGAVRTATEDEPGRRRGGPRERRAGLSPGRPGTPATSPFFLPLGPPLDSHRPRQGARSELFPLFDDQHTGSASLIGVPRPSGPTSRGLSGDWGTPCADRRTLYRTVPPGTSQTGRGWGESRANA